MDDDNDDLREQFADAVAEGDFAKARRIGAKWSLEPKVAKDAALRSQTYLNLLKGAAMAPPKPEVVAEATKEAPKPKTMLEAFAERRGITKDQLRQAMTQPMEAPAAPAPPPPKPAPVPVPAPVAPPAPVVEAELEPVAPPQISTEEREAREVYFRKRRRGINHNTAAASSVMPRHIANGWRHDWDRAVEAGAEKPVTPFRDPPK